MGDGLDPKARGVDDLEHDLARIDDLAGHDVGRGYDAADRRADFLALDERRHQLLALLAQGLELTLGFLDLDLGTARGAFIYRPSLVSCIAMRASSSAISPCSLPLL